MNRIIAVALCDTRGGDFHIDKAVESCVDGPGYYELVGFAFVNELKRLLRCKSTKPIIIVTAGVVRALETYIFNRETSPLIPYFFSQVKVYRWKSLVTQIIGLVSIFNFGKLFLPLYMRRIEMMIFLTSLIINPNAPFKVATKLPMVLPTIQYVEQISPRTQRVIMKIGDGSSLFENKGEQSLSTPLIEIKTKVHNIKLDGDASKLVPISESLAQKILSPKKQGAEVSRIIDVRAETGEVKMIVTETLAQRKYEPLSQRTKTLKDLENELPRSDFIEAEIFERKVEESCKAKLLPFLQIEDK